MTDEAEALIMVGWVMAPSYMSPTFVRIPPSYQIPHVVLTSSAMDYERRFRIFCHFGSLPVAVLCGVAGGGGGGGGGGEFLLSFWMPARYCQLDGSVRPRPSVRLESRTTELSR